MRIYLTFFITLRNLRFSHSWHFNGNGNGKILEYFSIPRWMEEKTNITNYNCEKEYAYNELKKMCAFRDIKTKTMKSDVRDGDKSNCQFSNNVKWLIEKVCAETLNARFEFRLLTFYFHSTRNNSQLSRFHSAILRLSLLLIRCLRGISQEFYFHRPTNHKTTNIRI